MANVKDVESRSQTITARDGRMLVTGKLLEFGIRLVLTNWKYLAMIKSEIRCEI